MLRFMKLMLVALLAAGLINLFTADLPAAEAKDKGKDEAKEKDDGSKNAPAPAGDDEENPEQEYRKDIDNAIKKGVEYLKGKQGADGSWIRDNGPFVLNIPMNEGTTAITLYALLKCGVKPTDPCITKGFDFIRTAGFKNVYAVACFCLAMEALYTSPKWNEKKPKKKKEDEKGDKFGTSVDEGNDEPDDTGWLRAPATDLKLFKDAIEWLISKQEKNVWRYPMPGGEQGGGDGALACEDASNSQYVALAFSVARRINQVLGRMEIPIKPDVFTRVLDYYIEKQEKDGPEVQGFPVPGADHSFKELQAFERDFSKLLKKARDKEKSKKAEPGQYTTEVITKAQDKIYGGEGKPMKSRGWCYMLGSKTDWRIAVTGSMTTSGVISCLVAKAWLEDLNGYTNYQVKTDQAIRDGCAWLAKNWTVSANPCSNGKGPVLHHYYYLYGLERVGMLAMVYDFGTHDWFEEGTKAILPAQGADGGWQIGQGTCGPIVDTDFALLFLKRATQPLVKMPEVWTGDYMGGKKK